MLSIKNLSISAQGTPIVKNFSLEIAPGEVHAIMGPNGSGKSTLVNALAGHPAYEITGGSVEFLPIQSGSSTRGSDSINLLDLEPHERAQAGLFLAFQYPKEIAGVSLRDFLFAASNAVRQARDPDAKRLSPFKFKSFLEEKMKVLHMDPFFADRFVNKGFSGGEKKKAEVLQMHVLEPSLALLDETDSGLDVDALKTVAEGVNALRASGVGRRASEFSALIVTHYARILEYIEPDFVHVMVNGEIKESGGADLAHKLEKEGYMKYGINEKATIALDTN